MERLPQLRARSPLHTLFFSRASTLSQFRARVSLSLFLFLTRSFTHTRTLSRSHSLSLSSALSLSPTPMQHGAAYAVVPNTLFLSFFCARTRARSRALPLSLSPSLPFSLSHCMYIRGKGGGAAVLSLARALSFSRTISYFLVRRTCARTCSISFPFSRAHTHTHTHTHTLSLSLSLARTHTRTHSDTVWSGCSRTHTHTHTRTHSLSLSRAHTHSLGYSMERLPRLREQALQWHGTLSVAIYLR